MAYILNLEHYRPQPGTILKVRSTRAPAVEHWGVVYWPDSLTGEPYMIHGMKGDVYRITSKSAFDDGQPCTVVWTPETPDQAASIQPGSRQHHPRSKRPKPMNLQHRILYPD